LQWRNLQIEDSTIDNVKSLDLDGMGSCRQIDEGDAAILMTWKSQRKNDTISKADSIPTSIIHTFKFIHSAGTRPTEARRRECVVLSAWIRVNLRFQNSLGSRVHGNDGVGCTGKLTHPARPILPLIFCPTIRLIAAAFVLPRAHIGFRRLRHTHFVRATPLSVDEHDDMERSAANPQLALDYDRPTVE